MRAYSTRPLERTIGRYSKLIKSKVDSGTNAGNLVERISILNHIHSSIDFKSTLNLKTKRPYSENSYIDFPSKKTVLPQLWSPIKTEFDLNSINNNYSLFLGIPITNTIIKNSLCRYYKRTLPGSIKQLDSSKITIAGRALIKTTLYSSVFRRHQINEFRRGNHHILFEIPVKK